MTSRTLALTSDAHDPRRLAAFWAGLLGQSVVDGAGGPLVPGSGTQVGLRFAQARSEKVGPNRVHLHLTSNSPAGQQDTVAAAVALGADHLDVGQLPDEGHIVLADPEGNEFCVIEAGNAYLAGCGPLGELACDGTRAVGLFWSEALGWPLVWEEGEQTAVQSPAGGTKVAWGGPPLAPKVGRSRQRFHLTLTGGDLAAEVDRLVGLGATLGAGAGADDGAVELVDPDGNQFQLAPG